MREVSPEPTRSKIAACPQRPREALIVDSPVAALVTMRGAPGVEFEISGTRQSVAPERWLAYRRPDGRLIWLAGDGAGVALTDGSLRGWAWAVERVAVIDAAHAGRVLSYVAVR